MRSPIWGTLLVLAAGIVAACGGGGNTSVALTTSGPLEKAANVEDTVIAGLIELRLSGGLAATLYVAVENTSVGIQSSEFDVGDGGPETAVRVDFKSPAELGIGHFADTVTIHVCKDAGCTDEIRGSPAVIPVSLYVTGGERDTHPAPLEPATADAAYPALPIAGQHALGHDVIDAEYSEALDAIVMVASYPSPKLHLYAASGTAQSVVLDASPNVLSVSPDGLTAAVGHDGVVTIVDLANIESADPTTVVATTLDVGEIVLAGNGYAHLLPQGGGSTEPITSINLATGVETATNWPNVVDAAGRAVMHPAGSPMYVAKRGTQAVVEAYSVDAVPLVPNGSSSPNFDTPRTPCGSLWIDDAGANIYSACGHVFRAGRVGYQPLEYAGSLPLAPSSAYPSQVKSLSQSTEAGEVALIEELQYPCEIQQTSPDCHTRFAIHGAYLDLVARYSLAPVTAAGKAYRQRGRFVFHSADGTKRYLVSRLWGMVDPAQAWLIGTVNVAGPATPPAPAPVVQPSDEAGLAAAALVEFGALAHDVIDAEFSESLNAIVMVSSYPTNAVYVRGLATGSERSIALTHVPSAVSVAPDGTHAAVGHDRQVTIVDLAVVGAVVPKILDTSIEVLDLVMAGNGYVYAFPVEYQLEPMVRSINIATGAESSSSAPIYAGTLARLHPSGTKIYGANRNVVPDDIERYSIAGTAQVAYDSPYHGTYAMCGNLWFSESGARIYTRCGATFASSDVQAQDMVHVGTLGLTSGHKIVSAAESAETQELTLVERRDSYRYDPIQPEYRNHLSFYNAGAFAPTVRYSISPLMVAGKTYGQIGVLVVKTGDGGETFLLSRLFGMPNPLAEFYISRLDH